MDDQPVQPITHDSPCTTPSLTTHLINRITCITVDTSQPTLTRHDSLVTHSPLALATLDSHLVLVTVQQQSRVYAFDT